MKAFYEDDIDELEERLKDDWGNDSEFPELLWQTVRWHIDNIMGENARAVSNKEGADEVKRLRASLREICFTSPPVDSGKTFREWAKGIARDVLMGGGGAERQGEETPTTEAKGNA